MLFTTKASAEAEHITTALACFKTAGYASAGDGGGALYKRAVSEPAHAGKIQSADGAWWELQGNIITPEMFGGVSTSTALNDVAFPACVAYLGVRGGGIVLLEKLYQRGAVLNVDQPNITFTSTQRGGVWLRGTPNPGNTHLFFVSVKNVTFRSIEICGDAGVDRAHANFGIIASTCDNLLVEDCDIHDLLNGIWVFACTGFRAIFNRLTDLIGGGCQVNNGCINWLMHGNRALRVSDDVFVSVSTSEYVPLSFPTFVRSAYGVISSNIVEDSLSTATPIRITASDYVTVVGNVVHRCPSAGISVVGHHSDGYSFNVVISGNVVAGYGLTYGPDSTFDNVNENVGSTAGIYVSEGSFVTVADNSCIEGAPTGNGAGIRIDGKAANVKLIGNHIALTTYGIAIAQLNYTDGIYDVSIENNTIVSVDSWPILISPGSTLVRDILIKDNIARFSHAGGGSIRVENTGAANVLVKNNVSFYSGAVSIAASATGGTCSGNDQF